MRKLVAGLLVLAVFVCCGWFIVAASEYSREQTKYEKLSADLVNARNMADKAANEARTYAKQAQEREAEADKKVREAEAKIAEAETWITEEKIKMQKTQKDFEKEYSAIYDQIIEALKRR